MTAMAHIIFYVANQERSTDFYSRALAIRPRLNVPGMTEFELGPGLIFGLMPEANARRLLGAEAVALFGNIGSKARAELYLYVQDVHEAHHRALEAGAKELSKPALRNWGHEVAYSMDPDGHVIAFAKKVSC